MKELIVPISVIAMLLSLLVPMPNVILDLLLVANLFLALVLLISTLVINEPLKLSSLPSLLLLATMFRLALNVSTTRLILGAGGAGAVVEAFGSVVVRKNLVVGFVIFLVITLIQFIVIAKGSERVAEVSARFTLDAMPGKQMSIDADVRAGLIDFNEARKKRDDLQIESRFYGALDGAMKFIKGDAIAGIVITFINVIGGFIVGVVIDDIGFLSSLQKYTLLSVGDGLVSQIPALLNSLAAGMIVTRVTCNEKCSLSTDLVAQLSQNKKVLFLASLLALCAAIIPGMPLFPFLSLALVLFVISLMEAQPHKVVSNDVKIFEPHLPDILYIEFTPQLAHKLVEFKFDTQIKVFQQVIFDKYGLLIQQPEFKLKDSSYDYQVFMRGISVFKGVAEAKSEETINKLINKLLFLVAERKVEFVDDQMTRRLLDHAEKYMSELVATVVPNILSITQVTTVIRELINEDIPIRNFDLILQALAEYGAKAGSERILLEEVRLALKRLISNEFSSENVINAYILDPVLDMECAKSERGTVSVDFNKIQKLICDLGDYQQGSALLTSRAARKLVKEFLSARGLKIPVLAHDEIVSSVTINQLGIVGEIEEKEELLNANYLNTSAVLA